MNYIEQKLYYGIKQTNNEILLTKLYCKKEHNQFMITHIRLLQERLSVSQSNCAIFELKQWLNMYM